MCGSPGSRQSISQFFRLQPVTTREKKESRRGTNPPLYLSSLFSLSVTRTYYHVQASPPPFLAPLTHQSNQCHRSLTSITTLPRISLSSQARNNLQKTLPSFPSDQIYTFIQTHAFKSSPPPAPPTPPPTPTASRDSHSNPQRTPPGHPYTSSQTA